VVTLRPVTVSDADAMWQMVNDPEGNDLTATAASFTFEQIRDWCAGRAEQQERLDLAIVENATGEYAGEVVLNEYDPQTETANFRISLRGPRWYGRGLGTEATRLIVRHGLDTIGLRRITLAVLARNPRAQRVYEKSGFRRTGEFVEDGEQWIEMETSPPLT
jgi:RimJ/RimL family protein N-acetyltransferase